MLAVLSPAKTLDFEKQTLTRRSSTPELLPEAKRLAGRLKEFSREDFAELMGISERLADNVHEYYHRWEGRGRKQAILAFRGDVYQGLEADDFTADDFAFAQEHLRILSGLYGALRPLDLIEPYRLEMGTKLVTPRGKSLYEFWGTQVTEAVNRAIKEQKGDALINLASNEYFRAIAPAELDATVITPAFKDYKGGRYKILSFFAKKARGQMARYLVKNRLANPADLKGFDTDGYRFNAELSSDTQWVFTRKRA
jgi:cytoplasmic iron level regulating protein YaaA (DUF328/UPF0246 family)